jgi:hypothetical protein
MGKREIKDDKKDGRKRKWCGERKRIESRT